MARRSTYLAFLAPVALFLAAMVSADGKGSLLSPSPEAVTPRKSMDASLRPAATRPVEHVPHASRACGDSQSCYHVQLRRLQEAALH